MNVAYQASREWRMICFRWGGWRRLYKERMLISQHFVSFVILLSSVSLSIKSIKERSVLFSPPQGHKGTFEIGIQSFFVGSGSA